MQLCNLTTQAATGKQNNQFVGIKILNNKVCFYHPATFVLSDDDKEKRKQILSILKTVSLAKTFTKDKSLIYTKSNNNDGFALNSYLWIINDYLLNGKYVNHEKEFKQGIKGKINWKRTLESTPIISNGNIIYKDIVSETKNQKDNLLCEIYNFCVQKSIDSIGWLYGLNFDNNGVDYYKLFNGRKRVYLNAIHNELSSTFDDQKKMRLNHMSTVITGLDDDLQNTDEIIYGVDSYEYVFEKLIDYMFSNIKDKKKFYPNATWDLCLEDEPVESSNLRPDTILIKGKDVFILDAKYYQYGLTFDKNDVPDTTSVQKQITYAEYVKKLNTGEYEKIYNAFVMPYSKKNNKHNDKLNEDIVFVGIANAEWKDKTKETYKNIVGLLIDMNFLVNNWSVKNDKNIDLISKKIEDNVWGFTREQH